VKEEQLGYECQNKIDGVRCSQGRIKADVLFGYIADNIPKRARELSNREYHMYVLAVHAFTKKQNETMKSEK